MKKTLILIIILLIILALIPFLSYLNPILNNIIAGKPNNECNVDSDCVLRPTKCSPNLCNCGDPVNKEWKSFCPFLNFRPPLCEPCPEIYANYTLRCISEKCEVIWHYE
jgi:hypothetical protein